MNAWNGFWQPLFLVDESKGGKEPVLALAFYISAREGMNQAGPNTNEASFDDKTLD